VSRIKRFIKRTPLGPFARSVYRALKPRSANEISNQKIRAVLKRHLTEDSICIDVGALRGVFLKHIVAIAPKASHVAFEPIPEYAEQLRRRFPNVRIHQFALADRTGEATFQYVVNIPAYSGLRKRAYPRDPEVQELTVRVDRLDNVIPADLPVRFLKIDVEGGELQVMQGGLKTIKRCRPLIVFEAGPKSSPFYDTSPGDFLDLLVDELGMKLSSTDRWLEGMPAYSRSEFAAAFETQTDTNYLAYP